MSNKYVHIEPTPQQDNRKDVFYQIFDNNPVETTPCTVKGAWLARDRRQRPSDEVSIC